MGRAPLWRRMNGKPADVIRMPHLVSEAHFTDGCSRCQKCVERCETGVIVIGAGGFPELDFDKAECSFCGRCATVCPEPLFLPAEDAPWPYVVALSDSCLTFKGIECRSCADACEEAAIVFKPAIGISHPILSTACTGCGACLSRCPSQSLSLKQELKEPSHD
ncbi:periplasmic nitrate reductase maturation protein NapF [Ferrimonas sediminum]|uniref:Ferredoxin-type protein NapF n=1 Tax=Ferrimonas sediminum TaxID=718193 RepID=A0A1G8R552_9GAMM|nr:ferredoxin-type protein NapF [Ferrimonas sediminum]SDJ12068.1 periplasmic nitrate reductase maturation protein NapF [Ferrimonas sediminum]